MSSKWDPPGLETQWGPPGLETPSSASSVPGSWRTLAVAAFFLVVIFGVPWCTENIGSVDLLTGKRKCGAPPSQIRVWAFTHYTRRPSDAVDLQKWIARHPGQINKQYSVFCDTPLHVAAKFGREDLAEPLVVAGADLEAVNGLHDRPLQTAAEYGHPSVVRLLLARGANVNASDPWGKTALHAAAFGLGTESNIAARIEVAKLLIAAGANVNARDGSGFTPLRYAMSDENRNTAMAALLLSHGADPRGAEEQPSPSAPHAR